ncbi:MAG: beta-ketoacyl synthase N-terminal-like domain-containing protein, partial [Pseudomonadota bacterium]
MSSSVHVVGVGMIPFTKPSASEPYNVMGGKAAIKALQDAGVEYSQIQQAYVGYVFGDSTCGQAALYGVGMTGIPVINVNNNCSTGSTALFLGRQAIESGSVDCVLVLGFEQMSRGALSSSFSDRPDPLQRFVDTMQDVQGRDADAPIAAQLFAGGGRKHMEMFGT